VAVAVVVFGLHMSPLLPIHPHRLLLLLALLLLLLLHTPPHQQQHTYHHHHHLLLLLLLPAAVLALSPSSAAAAAEGVVGVAVVVVPQAPHFSQLLDHTHPQDRYQLLLLLPGFYCIHPLLLVGHSPAAAAAVHLCWVYCSYQEEGQHEQYEHLGPCTRYNSICSCVAQKHHPQPLMGSNEKQHNYRCMLELTY
jgi:hypothetical protein